MSQDHLDPLKWAKFPRSQAAIGHVFEGSRQGDERFKQILEGHIRDGVCDEQGNLLLVWCAGQWVKLAWYVRVNNERRSA